VAPVALPEQRRAALLTEAALRCLARAKPFEPARLRKSEILVLDGRRRHVVPGLLAALDAMAGNDRPECAGYLKPDGCAQARAGFRWFIHALCVKRESAPGGGGSGATERKTGIGDAKHGRYRETSRADRNREHPLD